MPEIPDRDEKEERLREALLILFAGWLGWLLSRLLRPSTSVDTLPDLSQIPFGYWEMVEGELRAAVAPLLAEQYADGARRAAGELGILLDEVELSRDARAWGAARAKELAEGVVGHTEQGVLDAVAQYYADASEGAGAQAVLSGELFGEAVALETLPVASLEDRISRYFSEERAESIAVTETTGANTRGELDTVRDYERMLGRQVRVVWRTKRDERVCPKCGPLNGLPEEQWPPEAFNGPPLHPRCRCTTTIELGGDDGGTDVLPINPTRPPRDWEGGRFR